MVERSIGVVLKLAEGTAGRQSGGSHFMTFYTVILSSWAIFLLVWAVAAFRVKRDVRGRGFASVWSSAWPMRVIVALVLIAAAMRMGGSLRLEARSPVPRLRSACSLKRASCSCRAFLGKRRSCSSVFPNAYPQYQADTKRLIPFVW
jgi:hypothetical protein